MFGSLAERYGRLPTVAVTVGLMSVMSIVCALSGTFLMLFLRRFIQGIGTGGEVPIAAAYINELSQAPRVRIVVASIDQPRGRR